MGDVPSFDEFYAATHHGRLPFPWQTRLAADVVTGGWPAEIGVPTGMGKTACIDIAVWALASQAAEPPASGRTAATRTWYVVNRRLLVDSAHQHGEALARWLKDPAALRADWDEARDHHIEAIKAMASALTSVAGPGSEQGPLHVTRLRGGADLGARSPVPSQPALVFATVPMFASRWLFRGYGSSTSMRPVDAALAGIDSLVLLDEAHLAEPLARLAEPLAACDIGDPGKVLPAPRSRPRLVALTATGQPGGDRFELGADDLAHPEIRKRLHAAKPTTVRSSRKKKLPADLADAALEVLARADAPTSCLVFANTPRTAREVFDLLEEKVSDGADRHLLTGRMREREAAAARRAILDEETGAPSGRGRKSRDRHLVVVATQTLEVGADVDFEHLVTETAGVRSVVQRFGRLNRLGDFGHATATVVHPEGLDDWPVYGTEPADVHRRLVADTDPARSLNPERIGTVLGDPQDVPTPAGELLPHHLWDWAKTSEARPALAEPELFYGDRDDSARVSVLWRAYVPGVEPEPGPDGNENDHVDATIVEGGVDQYADGRAGSTKPLFPRLVPGVAGDEAVEIPPWEVRGLLEARGVEWVARLRPDGATVETVAPTDLRSGDQIVLRARGGKVGSYDDHGWAPDRDEPVADLSQLRAGLVFTVDAVRAVFEVPEADLDDLRTIVMALNRPVELGDDVDERREQDAEQLRRLRVLVDRWEPPSSVAGDEHDGWSTWRVGVLDQLGRSPGDLAWLDDRTRFVPVESPRRTRTQAGVRSDAFDDLSFTADATSPVLTEHLSAAANTTTLVAGALGLATDIAEVVWKAAALHDLGKLDERFQRWLDPEADLNAPGHMALAKSSTPRHLRETTRQASGWPRGGRHELLSTRLLDEALGDEPHRDLLLHLVVSHHGHGRPAVGVVDDPTPTKVAWQVPGDVTAAWTLPVGDLVTVHGDLSLADQDQPARFRRLCGIYGYWGLALLEAIVRQSDHAVSAAPGVDTRAPDMGVV